MTRSTPISPRTEALKSILEMREAYMVSTIDPDTWRKLVDVAWDNRAQVGDRREIQRELREILLMSTKDRQ